MALIRSCEQTLGGERASLTGFALPSCTRPAPLSCMMASGERLGYRTNQERGLRGHLRSGLFHLPEALHVHDPVPRCTMPSAKPGTRCTCISERTYWSMAARSGPPSAEAADKDIAEAIPQATARKTTDGNGW